MAPLNIDEQQRIQAHKDLEAKRARGEHVSDYELERAKTIAENQVRNAEAREARKAQLKAEQDAEHARRQAKYDAESLAAQDQHMRWRRASWRGTEAQWEEMKGSILQDYLMGRDDEAFNDVVAQKRQQIGGLF